MRETYVFRNGKVVLKQDAGPRQSAGPMIISDTMADTWHPANGKTYSSKSRFRAVTRAHGLTEYGTEKIEPKREQAMRPAREDIRKSIAMLREGYKPQPLERAEGFTRIKDG